jgi:hypothetical protein
MEPDPTSVIGVGESQPWSITNTLKNVATLKSNKTRQKQQQQQQQQSHPHETNDASTPQIVHDSSLSIYERVRHFLYINFVLNKKSFILSILSYLADLVLFIALNLYLFSNKKFLNEMICLPVFEERGSSLPNSIIIDVSSINASNGSSIISRLTKRELLLNQVASDDLNSILNLNSNNNNFSSHFRHRQLQTTASKSLKQSYLTLQIIIIFVFFICFILSYLIKLQFKYHRLALNLYDYDIELGKFWSKIF